VVKRLYLDVEQRREEELRAEHLVVAELAEAAGRVVAEPLGHVAVALGLHDAHPAVVALDVGAGSSTPRGGSAA